MKTTIEMLWEGEDWVPLFTDDVLHAANVPSWVTCSINNGHEGILEISIEDITAFDNSVQKDLDELVEASIRI